MVEVEEKDTGSSMCVRELLDSVRIVILLQWDSRVREKDGTIFDVEAVWDGGNYVLGGDGRMNMRDLKRIQEKIKPKVGMVGGNDDNEVFIISPRMINTLAGEINRWAVKTISMRDKQAEREEEESEAKDEVLIVEAGNGMVTLDEKTINRGMTDTSLNEKESETG